MEHKPILLENAFALKKELKKYKDSKHINEIEQHISWIVDGREVHLGLIYPCFLGSRMLGSIVFQCLTRSTLGKGLNRKIAILATSALGVGAHYLASLSGATGEPILIGAFVFVLALALLITVIGGVYTSLIFLGLFGFFPVGTRLFPFRQLGRFILWNLIALIDYDNKPENSSS
ncbi:hypothetical protein JHK82_033421 [Glycine max]|nr:hypothetical protein JHK85_034143 [Glycine max]KAG4985820.1 hypothetical protein JHK86_033511 [Glycine max]KAG5119001.1 hypothetical protein JHK82_033421 [Glycine max]KAG5139995.1 hypothetical protein JHK84_033763 [Glycine max]